jgi:hypothetical protein
MEIRQLESAIVEQRQVVVSARDLLNQELIMLAEVDDSE